MHKQIAQDRIVVPFAGADAGTAPLTWGQKAILRDMQDNGSQFTMTGTMPLPPGSTVAAAAARLSGLIGQHAALRTRLSRGPGDRQYQAVDGSGQVSLDVLTIPDGADQADIARYVDDLQVTWPLVPFDFHRDWPLRMAVLRHRGACLRLAWVLSHLIADGAAHLLLLADLIAGETAGGAASRPGRQQILDIARDEQEPRLRQLSSRAMRYWESQLRDIPALTFGEPAGPPGDSGQPGESGQRHAKVRFSSTAAHLAILAIARRTGTDVSRVTLAVIATAIGRATGMSRLTVNVMVNNRFRPGLADVIAPIAQNSVVTIDVADASIDHVVRQARAAALTAGMRAYYDPDELAEVITRLDAERGFPARVSCRINDQRAMIRSTDDEAGQRDVTLRQVRQRLTQTSLTWLGPMDHLHDQASFIVENLPDVVSLYLMCDLRCFTTGQVEALLRGVEEVAVEAAFDPVASTRISGGDS
ncbi:MAG: condensation domain-containing protein [Streptosporangiaceae bacterium]